MYRGISALFVDKLLQVMMELSLTLGTLESVQCSQGEGGYRD